MPNQSRTFTIATTDTPPDTNVYIKVFDAVNSGSFAVVLVAGIMFMYLNKIAKSVVNSDTAKSFVGLVEQIRANQLHIIDIKDDVDNLEKTTADLVLQLGQIQKEIASGTDLNTKQHIMIMREITNLKQILAGGKTQ